MAIFREVKTEVYCDVCGKYIISWKSKGAGVSRLWAAYYARQRGCTTGKQIICKECRIKKRIKACSLQKKWGAAQKDADGSCLGFSNENDDEPIDKCKNCIACSAFDWEEERMRLSI